MRRCHGGDGLLETSHYGSGLSEAFWVQAALLSFGSFCDNSRYAETFCAEICSWCVNCDASLMA